MIRHSFSPSDLRSASKSSGRIFYSALGALVALPLLVVLTLGPTMAAPPAKVNPAKGIAPTVPAIIPTSKGVVDAIVLQQTSTFVGKVEMTVSDNGIRFGMAKMGIVWMTFAPKWDGIAYNPEAKSYLVRPHSEWKKKLFNLPTGKKATEDLGKFAVKETGKKEMIGGYNCRKEALIGTPSKKHKDGEPTKPYTAGYIWVADDFPAPKEVGELMSNFVRVEVKKGIVLRADMLKTGSYTEYKPVFETLKITKKKVPASLFDPPKNFKLVTSELQLMMGDSDSDTGMGAAGAGSTEDLLKKLK
jgi:hypothetical protein